MWRQRWKNARPVPGMGGLLVTWVLLWWSMCWAITGALAVVRWLFGIQP
jgi:hypothetical protein